MTDHPVQLFVYGTLMPGYGNCERIEHLIRSARPATTTGILIDLGSFPGLIQGDGIVRGVVLEVEKAALTVTDHIEGYVPGRARNLYEREEVSVDLDNGGSVRAWTYIFGGPKVIADSSRLIIRQQRGKPLYAWNPRDPQSLPNDRSNGSNS